MTCSFTKKCSLVVFMSCSICFVFYFLVSQMILFQDQQQSLPSSKIKIIANRILRTLPNHNNPNSYWSILWKIEQRQNRRIDFSNNNSNKKNQNEPIASKIINYRKKLGIYPRSDMKNYIQSLEEQKTRTTANRTFHWTPNHGTFSGAENADHNCERVAGDEFLKNYWKSHERIVCSSAATKSVKEFVLDHLDVIPAVRIYKDVIVEVSPKIDYQALQDQQVASAFLMRQGSSSTPLREKLNEKLQFSIHHVAGCENQSQQVYFTGEKGQQLVPDWYSSSALTWAEKTKMLKTTIDYDDKIILIKIHRFHLGNPYEAMHSYLNYYLMLRAFVFDSKFEKKSVRFVFSDDYESTLRDDQFWDAYVFASENRHNNNNNNNTASLTSNHFSYYTYTGRDRFFRSRKSIAELFSSSQARKFLKVATLIEGPTTGFSVLVSSAFPLHGRMANHKCASSLTQNATKWIRANFARMGDLPSISSATANHSPNHHHHYRKFHNKKTNQHRIEVVWCSRSIHAQAGGKLVFPSRALHREKQFVLALREALGPDFKLRVVDFGKLDGPESIAAVETAQVLIGFHGAGLTWGMFMQPSHAAVIEIFGDDRGSDNKHYANIARFQDYHYQGFSKAFRMDTERLSWWNSENNAKYYHGEVLLDRERRWGRVGGGEGAQAMTDNISALIRDQDPEADVAQMLERQQPKLLLWDKDMMDLLVHFVFDLPWVEKKRRRRC